MSECQEMLNSERQAPISQSNIQLDATVVSMLLGFLPGPAALIDRAGHVLAANRPFLQRIGSDAETPRLELETILSKASWSRCQPLLAVAQVGAASEAQGALVSRSGGQICVEASWTPFPGRGDNPQMILLQLDRKSSRASALAAVDQVPGSFPDDVLVFESSDALTAIHASISQATGGQVDKCDLERRLKGCLSCGLETFHVRSSESESGKTARGQTAEVRLVPYGAGGMGKPAIVAFVRHNVDHPDDIDEYKRLALRDVLTGLLNRKAFADEVRDRLRSQRQKGFGLAVFFLDLDDFKRVNDLGGHDTGDEILRQVAQSLEASLGEAGLAARIGGDEFAALAWPETAAASIKLAERIQKNLSKIKVESEGLSFVIGGSIGIAYLAAENDFADMTPDRLLKLADSACLRGKRSGGRAVRMKEI